MAITFLPQARAVLGDQTLNFAPLNAGLDSVIQGNRQNALMAENRRQFDESQKQQNALLDVERQKLARGPERPWWAGQDGSIDPAMQRYRELGRPQTNVNVTNAQESAYDKETGKLLAKYFVEGQEAAGKARNSIANMNIMRQALADPNLYTGTAGNTVQGLKKAAQTVFGVPVEGVASGEVVQNLSNKIALSFKDELPGPMSNSDREFLLTLPPGLTKSPEGNRRIIEMGLLNERYKLERARAANVYAKANGGRLDRGFFDQLEKIDERYAPQFANLVGQLRSSVQEPARSPMAGIPQGAINYLQGNPTPDIMRQFDEKFGPGASQRVLGGATGGQ